MRKQGMLVFMVLASTSACAMDFDEGLPERTGVAVQALDSAHTRVIQECSQAMSGSWSTYDSTNWPTGTTYGTYAYVSSDLGAWGRLLDATYGCTTNTTGSCITPWTRGWWTSCQSTVSVRNYTLCTETYGDLDTATQFDCQGSCTNGVHHHGGQCKPFMNLVAYRSGLYQAQTPTDQHAWKAFPPDSAIAASDPNGTLMPKATYANIVEGDYLRRPKTSTVGDPHATIVVKKIDSAHVIVMDSNWVNGGDGNETIGSHSMGFTGTGAISDLGSYRVLKCVYAGGC